MTAARRHVVLVGLPGSGKTTVGRLVAAQLGAPFIDLDEVIAAQAGKSIPALFAQDGEAAFRALERAAASEILRGPPCVIATGGGFMADPGRRELATSSGLVVYLQTSAAEAAARLGGGEGSTGRPLLDGLDLKLRLPALLAEREPGYLEAQQRVTTDVTKPEIVALAVAKLAREEGGW